MNKERGGLSTHDQDLGKKIKADSHGSATQLEKKQFSQNWKKLLEEHPEAVAAATDSPKPLNKQKAKKPIKMSPNDSTEDIRFKLPNGPQTNAKHERKVDVWFDDVDESLLEPLANVASGGKKDIVEEPKSLVAPSGITGLTQHVAIDCEMVGAGKLGQDDILARVSIVNQFGHCLYDKYVKPREKVTDYRTRFSGIRPENLKNAEKFDDVQQEVADIIRGRILIGHALHNDLNVLFLSHPRKRTRDTSRYKPFRKMIGCAGTPSLKRLTEKLLGVHVQTGSHDSVEDAQAAMKLYIMHKIPWETSLKQKRNNLKATASKRNSAQKPPNKGDKKKESVVSDRVEAQTTSEEGSAKAGKEVAIDCEMVGVGKQGKRSILARVSLVDSNCRCIYDNYVKPTEKIINYRTPISGITPQHLENAEEFKVVKKEVEKILRGKILIGHAVHFDLQVLRLYHPPRKIRDTADYVPFRRIACDKKKETPSLKTLASKILGIEFQDGSHDSVEDAQVAMKLYLLYKVPWEKWLEQKVQ